MRFIRAVAQMKSLLPEQGVEAHVARAGLRLAPLTPCGEPKHVQARKVAPQTLEVTSTGQRFFLSKVGLGDVTCRGEKVGRVKIGYDLQSRQVWAFKKINRTDHAAPAVTQLCREAHFAGVAQSDMAARALLVTDKRLYLQLPLMAGDIASWRNLDRAEKPAMLLLGMRAVFTDLQRSHALGVAHRDIKPGNIFYRDAPETVRLADYGIACATQEPVGGGGTPHHMAPEQHAAAVCRGGVADIRQADVWGVGATFLDIWVGNPFMTAPAQRSAMHRHYAQWHASGPSGWPTPRQWRFHRAFTQLPAAVRPLFLALLHPHPGARPSPHQATEQLDALLAHVPGLGGARASYRRCAAQMCDRWNPGL